MIRPCKAGLEHALEVAGTICEGSQAAAGGPNLSWSYYENSWWVTAPGSAANLRAVLTAVVCFLWAGPGAARGLADLLGCPGPGRRRAASRE